MKFYKPKNLTELFKISEQIEGKKYFLAGGTDINVQIKKKMITDEPIIYINHLEELQGIRETDKNIIIGSLCSYQEMLNAPIVAEYLPFLRASLANLLHRFYKPWPLSVVILPMARQRQM